MATALACALALPTAFTHADALPTVCDSASTSTTTIGRELAHDHKPSIGCFDKALDEAQGWGWTVVDIQQDWKVLFTFQNKQWW